VLINFVQTPSDRRRMQIRLKTAGRDVKNWNWSERTSSYVAVTEKMRN